MAKRKPKENWRYVDMWAVPGVHPTNVEFLQRLKTADTQHFTKNMDVVGTISEKNDDKKWEKSHLIGIRSDVWKPDEKDVAETLDHLQEKRRNELRRGIKRAGRLNAKQKEQLQEQVEEDKIMQMQCDDIVHRRLVLKTFRTTGKRVQWAGTLEQITTSETHNSMGSNRSLLTMAVMLPRHEYVTYIQQNHRTFRVPAIFSFCFFDEGRMWNICLRRKWLAAGADFEILIDGKKAGLVNGVLFAMGSDSYINLDVHPLTTCPQFLDLLSLFAASVGYHKAMRRSVKRRVEACKSGESHQHIIEDEELRLRHNGRSAA